MQNRSYEPRKLPSYSAVVSTLALIVALAALCVGGAAAAKTFITGKQIKNGTISSKDLAKGAVKAKAIGRNAVQARALQSGAVTSTALADNSVQTSDIGPGQVTPEEISVPDPVQLKFSDAVVNPSPTLDFGPLATLGTYQKQVGDSALEVNWTGSVKGENGGEFSGCVFQLRVDGQPSAAGAGEVFGRGLTSVSAAALFSSLPTGNHTIEVWARITVSTPFGNSCTIGPSAAGIGQTVVVAEQIG